MKLCDKATIIRLCFNESIYKRKNKTQGLEITAAKTLNKVNQKEKRRKIIYVQNKQIRRHLNGV